MSNDIAITVGATETASDTITGIGDATQRTERVIVQSMGSTEDAFDTAGRSSGKFGKGLDMVSGAGTQLADGLDAVGSAIDAVTELQDAGRQKAQRLAQAQNDVAQALIDLKQSNINATQATLDLRQAQINGTQAHVDAKQASIDLENANIAITESTSDYNDAVKEKGKNSLEAKKALSELHQANLDAEQAQVALTQANLDGDQSLNEAQQANADAAQAVVEHKQAQIDLNDAQHEAKPPTGLQEFAAQAGMVAPVIMGLVGIIDLFSIANTALSGSFITEAAASAASSVAAGAHAVAAGVATAAQWAWNAAIAFATSPITLIVLGVALLVAAIIWLATQTTFFQALWHDIWIGLIEPVMTVGKFIINFYVGIWNGLVTGVTWVKDMIVGAFSAAGNFASHALDAVLGIPGRLGSAFAGVGNAISAPFRAAFNAISYAWNNTAGRLSFQVPGWVPGMGGNGFSMPHLPTLQTGGEILRTGAVLAHAGERIMPAHTRGLSSESGSQGTTAVGLDFTGDTDSALATLIMSLIRNGLIQITQTNIVNA